MNLNCTTYDIECTGYSLLEGRIYAFCVGVSAGHHLIPVNHFFRQYWVPFVREAWAQHRMQFPPW